MSKYNGASLRSEEFIAGLTREEKLAAIHEMYEAAGGITPSKPFFGLLAYDEEVLREGAIAMEDLPEKLRNNPEVVAWRVTKYAPDIYYAGKDARNDPAVVEAAIFSKAQADADKAQGDADIGNAFQWAGAQARSNPRLVLLAASVDPQMLHHSLVSREDWAQVAQQLHENKSWVSRTADRQDRVIE